MSKIFEQGNFCPECAQHGQYKLMQKGIVVLRCPACQHAMPLPKAEIKQLSDQAELELVREERMKRAIIRPDIGEISSRFNGRNPRPTDSMTTEMKKTGCKTR
ncbi:hypothetical protein HN858_00905 [Candidatus Falkowbacteria bacterium]|mgnify:CR=1 FL=1|nr:hypothetical protein [Candidatus Falkowbacteria bacterium]MBT5503496.1 hypothetical protein [Candidatus Falkowbacteria bacterium]MBT6573968.1 hypothetical protein [Candidatus Falkowbacteria bacterium]MBT7348213.1 hypothetical protein [Candidatus Falkowbacteria bacterium]